MGNNQPKPDAFAFSTRLNTALDRLPDCPPRRVGRGAWLAAQLKVSQPTAHAWLKGDYMPTGPRVRSIAEKAGVSYEWLYFGDERSAPDHAALTDRQGERSGDAGPSQLVRVSDLNIALQLVGEALGRERYLPPAQYAELTLLLCRLVSEGLPEAQVLQVARAAAAIHHRGTDGQVGDGRKDQGAVG